MIGYAATICGQQTTLMPAKFLTLTVSGSRAGVATPASRFIKSEYEHA